MMDERERSTQWADTASVSPMSVFPVDCVEAEKFLSSFHPYNGSVLALLPQKRSQDCLVNQAQ